MRQKPIQRLDATARSVSKVRFRPANPFEHKRNFERGGAGFGVCDRVMAEGMGLSRPGGLGANAKRQVAKLFVEPVASPQNHLQKQRPARGGLLFMEEEKGYQRNRLSVLILSKKYC